MTAKPVSGATDAQQSHTSRPGAFTAETPVIAEIRVGGPREATNVTELGSNTEAATYNARSVSVDTIELPISKLAS